MAVGCTFECKSRCTEQVPVCYQSHCAVSSQLKERDCGDMVDGGWPVVVRKKMWTNGAGWILQLGLHDPAPAGHFVPGKWVLE